GGGIIQGKLSQQTRWDRDERVRWIHPKHAYSKEVRCINGEPFRFRFRFEV
ncbi:hypothetical protein C5167_039772, partial [Papaver somniferum]